LDQYPGRRFWCATANNYLKRTRAIENIEGKLLENEFAGSMLG